MRLMGGRRHQLPGVVGKHFGASDFEATPAEFDRCDRTVDSRCDHGGLLAGDQMGLNGLETSDGAPELLAKTLVPPAGFEPATPALGEPCSIP